MFKAQRSVNPTVAAVLPLGIEVAEVVTAFAESEDGALSAAVEDSENEIDLTGTRSVTTVAAAAKQSAAVTEAAAVSASFTKEPPGYNTQKCGQTQAASAIFLNFCIKKTAYGWEMN